MSYKIVAIKEFDRDLKTLNKKYHSIKVDFANLLDDLLENPTMGESLGKDCYKVRMKISSKNQGKSGGARVITCMKIIKETIYLLAIYDKSETENIDNDELKND